MEDIFAVTAAPGSQELVAGTPNKRVQLCFWETRLLNPNPGVSYNPDPQYVEIGNGDTGYLQAANLGGLFPLAYQSQYIPDGIVTFGAGEPLNLGVYANSLTGLHVKYRLVD